MLRLILIFALMMTGSLSAARKKPPEPAAMIEASIGAKASIFNKYNEKRQAKLGEPIFAGERLKVPKQTIMSLRFLDGSGMRVVGKAEMSIDEFKNSKEEGSLRISTGDGLYSMVSGSIAKTNPQSYKVEVGTATIGVRGTNFE